MSALLAENCLIGELDSLYFPLLWPHRRRSLNGPRENNAKAGCMGRDQRYNLGGSLAPVRRQRFGFCFGSTEMGLFRFQPSPSWFAAAPAAKRRTHPPSFSSLIRSSWNRCSNNRTCFDAAFDYIPRIRGCHPHGDVGDIAMPDCFSTAGFAWPPHCRDKPAFDDQRFYKNLPSPKLWAR